MESHDFQAYIEFAAISVAVAAGYLAAVRLVMGLAKLAGRFRDPRPAGSRPGEMVHQALKVSGRALDHYRTAGLLFGVSLLLLANFGRSGLWPPQSNLINGLMLAGLLVPVGFGGVRIFHLVRYRIQWGRLLELHRQMARRLVEVQLRGNRVFPSVQAGDGVIDNVVVGPNGVYSIQLITPPAGAESVRLERGSLVFQPGDRRVSLQVFNRHVAALGRRLGEAAGSTVPVLPVLVVPDCRIETGDEGGPMLVSLQACAAFISWQHDDFFLHDDDVARLSGWLGQQALSDPPGTMTEAISSLERHVGSTALA
jgi:hypothetical protein